VLQANPIRGPLVAVATARKNAAAHSTRAKGCIMPQLTVENVGTFEVPQGKRLVLALAQEAGVDQLHACGGNARCTTCRVEFVAGEPEKMTVAERDVLAARGLTGVRLSCQIVCDHEMTVRAISRLEGSGRKDAGHEPAAEIQPPPQWIDKPGA
jgi:ferredoxin